MKNRFDRVMDYIDECICLYLDDEDIRKGILGLIGYNSDTFSKCFLVLTKEKLSNYIRQRKFYFAAQQLKNTEKRVLDIAIDCGYSETAIFTRQMRAYYGCTPSDIRNGKADIPNDKYRLKDLYNTTSSTRANEMIKALELGNPISFANEEFLEELYETTKECCFDIDIGYAIADVAENLGVSAIGLLRNICEFVAEEKTTKGYLSPTSEYAMDCGIRTEQDLKKICDFYGCTVYDLNSALINDYYTSHNEN